MCGVLPTTFEDGVVASTLDQRFHFSRSKFGSLEGNMLRTDFARSGLLRAQRTP